MHGAALLHNPLPVRASAAVAIVVVLAWPALFWRLGHGPIDRTMDGREALVIREMVRTGDLVLPLRNGEDVPHKPPFMHWLGAAVAHVRGGVVDEATVRMPSALATLAALLVTCGAVAATEGAGRGLGAALVLLTTSSVSRHARESWVDPTLAAAVTAALACAWSMLRRERVGGPRLYLFHALVGVAFLAKGPVGLAVPALALLAFLWSTGRLALVRAFVRPTAVALLAAVVLPWYVAAFVRGGALFFRTQVLTENLVRLVYGPEGSQPPWHFLGAMLSEAAPWVFLLPFALHRAWRARRAPTLETFALAWLVAPFLFFSAAAGKRDVYLLPLMPAVAILVTEWFFALAPWQPWRPNVTWTAAGLAAGVAAVLLGAEVGAALGWLDPTFVARVYRGFDREIVDPLRGALAEEPAAVAVALACVPVAAALVAHAAGAGRPIAVLTALLLLHLPYVDVLKPLRWENHRNVHALHRFAAAVRAAAGTRPIRYAGTGELSDLFFYLDRHVPRARCARDFAACPPGLYLASDEVLATVPAERRAAVRRLAESRALSDGRRANVVLVEVADGPAPSSGR